MISHKKPISATVKFFLPILLVTALFACKKDVTTATTMSTKIEEEPATGFAPGPGNGGNSCYDYYALLPLGDGTLTGYVEDVPIQISNVRYQAYDDYGNPITYQAGDPFLGQINITSSTPAEMLYNSTNPQDDQFAMRIYQMGYTTINLQGYHNVLDGYYLAEGVALDNGNIAKFLFKTTFPKLSDWISQGAGSYHDVVGRLIRINPTQIQSGTNASGDPVFVTTTFALAPACYPRNGVRPGSNSATITPRNGDGCTSPSSVEFLQNGMVTRTIDFPTTVLTSGAPVSIPAGTYTLRFTIPTGYPFLTFALGPNYWESSGNSGSSRIFTTPGTVTLAAGASLYLVESIEGQ